MKFYKNFIIIWSVVYLVFALAGRSYSEKNEWFPFFRWSLYSKSRDKLEVSFVMVSKLGDSAFAKPKDLKKLTEIHHLYPGDINNEYIKINKDLEKNKSFNNLFFKTFFSEGSEYIMYKKYFDLSKKDYSKPTITKQLEYRNGKITIYD
ncbi:hypothetical protein [Lacinutrix sp. Bg11-31]|uniref:hypothetical protein n=1 Tax=Lacinutrix sp. Bg11-31 TaxID=2057808 RepID=UPI000C304F18|nr:hypothetical protein [Lacinutrix sp. Bg11-31]AUC80794.1 hypothetical protein CW733_01045 [Lacinutrix sp. Bg11-31]